MYLGLRVGVVPQQCEGTSSLDCNHADLDLLPHDHVYVFDARSRCDYCRRLLDLCHNVRCVIHLHLLYASGNKGQNARGGPSMLARTHVASPCCAPLSACGATDHFPACVPANGNEMTCTLRCVG